MLILEMKDLDHDNLKHDWIIVKEFFPPQEVPTDKSEVNHIRAGLTATKPLKKEDKNVVIFSNLTIKADEDGTKSYFVKNYLTNSDDKKVISSVLQMDKKILIVTLTDRQACKDFAAKYVTIPFNEINPRVSALLGGEE